MNTTATQRREEERIRDAYERRERSNADARCTFFDAANLAIIQERERATLTALRRYGFDDLASRSVLEVGCGSGFWLRQFIHWGARPTNVAGIELLPNRASQARESLPGAVNVVTGSAAQLPFADRTFDIVLQSVVFSSILDCSVRVQVAREMLRVAKPGALIVWYDLLMRNPRNPDVTGISKAEIKRLFPGCGIRLRRITLAPPLARVVTPLWSPLYTALASTRVFCTHYLGLITK